jgi:hypothetical protein
MGHNQDNGRRLRCESCGRLSDDYARGWTAPLGVEDDDTVVAVVMCPACRGDVAEHTSD